MINQHNFDWNKTNVPLCIFIPNYGRGSYIRNTLWQFTSKCNPSDFSIVIGNDGLHEDFSDLAHLNISYFTLERENTASRNGAFIRNYFIKRAKCRNLFQKDPETILQPMVQGYDWINQYTKCNYQMIRPAITLDIGCSPFNPERAHAQVSHRVHWGCLAPLDWIQHINGYSEDFLTYGYEDTHWYGVMQKNYGNWILDENLAVSHLGHFVPESVYKEVRQMAEVYDRILKGWQQPMMDWGNG